VHRCLSVGCRRQGGGELRLTEARVSKYRSIRDTGWFEVEPKKTILVGLNEAGKTALLQALQQINPPAGVLKLDPLRDYPRSEYNDITTGKVRPADVEVVSARFVLEPDDLALLPSGYQDAVYEISRRLDNSCSHQVLNGPTTQTYSTDLIKELTRLAKHADKNYDAEPGSQRPSERLEELTAGWGPDKVISTGDARSLSSWLNQIHDHIDNASLAEDNCHTKLLAMTNAVETSSTVLQTLRNRLPTLVLFNNYFRVKPSIHLEHFAQRIQTNLLDDEFYDYGNQCLLKLLGFTAHELSNLGKAPDPAQNDPNALQAYKDQLDNRLYQLNAASVRLTNEIRNVWNPDTKKSEPDRLRVHADGQYLKVVVEDDLGVEVELDQRSEGFQWLVSFFVVFFAEAADKHENAILLLDEPGLSLHGLKQREFRSTVSRLAEKNQTIYTTHSPFLVGPDELDLVRVVEMMGRQRGTVVHTSITASDGASLLPLQEALGYDLAQSLFTQQRNLVLEGLTDYWYIDGTSHLLGAAGSASVSDRVAILPADSAGKVVYYATILHAHNLKVAALLDSDSAGDTAAQQETLVHQLGNKKILRTKDAYQGPVAKPEIEDLLRDTLIRVGEEELGWDVKKEAVERPSQPIADIYRSSIIGFSKYKLAKAYLQWTRTHEASDLTPDERSQWTRLIELINHALR